MPKVFGIISANTSNFCQKKIDGKDIIIGILTQGTVLLLASNVGRNIGQVWLPLSVKPYIQQMKSKIYFEIKYNYFKNIQKTDYKYIVDTYKL